MLYYNKDPKRDHNFDNHPYKQIVLRIPEEKVGFLKQLNPAPLLEGLGSTGAYITHCKGSAKDRLQASSPLNSELLTPNPKP